MSTALLEVDGLTVRHGGLVALADVSIRVDGGTIAGLIGPNGAGKTTFIDTLSGFTPADAGSVRLDGRDLSAAAPHERSRAGMSRTFQSLELFEDLTVRDNLALSVNAAGKWSVLRDLWWPRRSEQPSIDATLERLDLLGVSDRLPPELPNGTRHLVALARAIVTRPRLLLLDEPAAGLDDEETERLGALLSTLPDDGITVLLVEHDMSLVLGICDVVHVLDFGGVIASGTPTEVRADAHVRSAYLGTTRTKR